ncbi:MAG: hypothetical protein QM236_00540 [Bacillota bacterium]|nr:hypothetical protein [Bacillota bacterium]HOA54862.1 hypothetical protein [Clostridiales bacterium]HPZ05721.1 hypothetical protein [Clostridiales bacterium]HQD31233.1 hypothetical protein [Clostridiales bacterium]
MTDRASELQSGEMLAGSFAPMRTKVIRHPWLGTNGVDTHSVGQD